jgi:hypothetical protein
MQEWTNLQGNITTLLFWSGCDIPEILNSSQGKKTKSGRLTHIFLAATKWPAQGPLMSVCLSVLSVCLCHLVTK